MTGAAPPSRGISPERLLENVRNTVPYLFEEPDHGGIAVAELPYLARLLEPPRELSHSEYYRLCVSAHFATVATPVPTDVDNQIRLKLWDPSLDSPEVSAMVDHVIEASTWDTRAVSRRWVASPESGRVLTGHGGEWLSIAAGAYCALRRRSPGTSTELAQRIVAEMKHEQEVYSELKRAGDGVGLLKAATLIAHNLGDLDRVMDLWGLPETDALRQSAYQAAHSDAPPARSGSPGPGLKIRAILAEAGDLNKAFMAAENHRHFALRAPKCLRKTPELLIPIGPFFDEWGARATQLLSAAELGEVVEALVSGFARLNSAARAGARGPVGYARALAGIEGAVPAIAVPGSGQLRQAIAIPRAEFEGSFAARALAFVKTR